MTTFFRLVNAAASRKTTSVKKQNMNLFVTPIGEALTSPFTANVSVIPTKMDYEKLTTQGGSINLKDANRKKYLKNKLSKQFDKMKSVGKKLPKDQRKSIDEARKEMIKNQPHSGIEQIMGLRKQAELASLFLPEDVWNKIEGFTLFALSLSECVSYTQALSIFLLYVKTHYNESLVKKASEMFRELFEDSEITPHGGEEKPEWLSQLRMATTNWRLVSSNPVFKKISYLISICITLGLCEAANFEWRLGNVKLFAISALEKHTGAFDLIDAAIETVLYFVEGGYAAFTTQSLSPFLYSDQQAREFDEEFSFLSANLEHVRTGNLRKLAGMDENAFDHKLYNATQLADNLYRSAKGTWEKKVFFDKRSQLLKMRATFDAIRVQGGLRTAPFTVNFYGKSGVGKSSVSAISMVHGLIANGFEAEDEMMVTLNESDKFMSTYRSFTNGIFIDDIGNTKPDFVEKSPTNKIIEICNNVRQYANMAEADMKGKVSIEPKFVNLTTNVKGLCATTYSNEPGSITRRAHLTVTVTVKPEFCKAGLLGSVGQQLDSEKVAEFYRDENGLVNIPVVPDLWNLTVERVILQPSTVAGRADLTDYEVVEHNGKLLQDVSIHEYLKCMVDLSRKHFAQQEMLVANSNNMAEKIHMCKNCDLPHTICECNTPHFGIVGYATGVAVRKLTDKVTSSVSVALVREGTILEKMATDKILRFIADLEESPYFSWTNYLPRKWLTHEYGRRFVLYALRDEVVARVRRETFATLSACAFLLIMSLLYTYAFLPLALPLLYRLAVVVSTIKERVYLEVKERNDAMPKIFKRVRDNHAKYVWMALGAVGTLYTLLKVWQGFRNGLNKSDSALNPVDEAEVAKRDAEANPWASVVYEPPPKVECQHGITIDQLTNLVHKNQVFLRIEQDDVYRTCGGLFVKSNVLMLPYHMWFKDADTSSPICTNLKIRITRNEKHEFTSLVSALTMVRIPGTDLTLTQVTNAPVMRDLTDYFPSGKLREGLCEMVYRTREGGRTDARARIKPGMVGHREQPFFGASYQLSIPTFNGLCMATFLMHGNPNYIVGFHLGGRTGTATGVLGSVTRKEIIENLDALSNLEGVCVGKSQGTLPTELYDKHFYLDEKAHPKSPVNFMEDEGNYLVYGAIEGSAKANSNVVQTIISDTVEEVCGVPQQWGPPQFNPAWKPWRESLKYSSNPSIGVEGSYLVWAVKDYQLPLLELVKKPHLNKDVRPLTRMETVCGRDGKRFIDKMPPSTSVGFPLSGPKSEYLTILDPENHPDQQFPVELDARFWDQFDVMKQEYLAGRRCYPIFKGCLKDEPTKLSKDKVRVFQAAPIALQLFVRMYFLPIARVLSLHPTLSECAVGINSSGPEWNELQQFITKHGRDRIFAGDYSKYDLRMPAQVMLAAFRILINIARASGNYTDEDLSIMEGVAIDICHPVVAYAGTLIQLIGSNPSGQNLTVYINSIVNSLLNRCGFYHIYEERREELDAHKLAFRDAVALMTYGDDVKGSVHASFSKFNHISYAKFLADRDMKFTMPDKESTPTEYMNDSDADFLKRKNIWNDEVGMYFGALDEQSIFKSLHSTLNSKFLGPEEQAATNIDGALREWFAHGRDTYEHRRAQMKEIASRHNLVCNETQVSYDERLEAWKEKYLEPQSGVEKKTRRLESRAKREIPFKCLGTEIPLIIPDITEVDMVFQRTFRGHSYIILVEIKSSNNPVLKTKGRGQLRRLINGLAVINPKLNYQGVLLTPGGYELVEAAGTEDFSIFDLPWSE